MLIALPYLMHYRLGVLTEMSRSTEITYEFAGGEPPATGSLAGVAAIPPGTLPRTHRLSNMWLGSWLWQRGLLRLVVSDHYSAVVFNPHYMNLSVWAGASIRRLLGRPVVYWAPGWIREDQGSRRRIKRLLYSMADLVLVYGDRARRIALSQGYDGTRIAVVGNSLPSADHLSAVELADARLVHLDLPTHGEALTSVLRLTARKRLDELLRVASVLRSEGRDVSVVLVGDGPEKGRLRTLASELGVPTYFTGALYDSHALARVYERTSVTVIPGHVGLTAIQSLDHGVPVVTHDDPEGHAPEFEALVDGVNAAFFARGSFGGLVRATRSLLIRVAEDPQSVRTACLDSVSRLWNPTAQASLIDEALLRMPELRARA